MQKINSRPQQPQPTETPDEKYAPAAAGPKHEIFVSPSPSRIYSPPHPRATADMAGPPVPPPPGQDQVFQRLEEWPQVRALQIEHDDIGQGAGAEPPQVVSPQRLGAA